MTLIVAIKCKDGIAIAADGAATFAAQTPTIRQPVTKKLEIIDGRVVIGVSGPIGLGQRFRAMLEELWRKQVFSKDTPNQAKLDFSIPANAMQLLREQFWRFIEVEMKVASISKNILGQNAVLQALSRVVVAIPLAGTARLFHFEDQAAPEESTEQLPFIAIGSGQQIADPFLAFIRRVFWNDGLPELAKGKFSAVWTVKHAIDTNPGGVSDPIQLVTMNHSAATECSRDEISEHLEMIKDIECHMGQFPVGEKRPPSQPPEPPATPQ